MQATSLLWLTYFLLRAFGFSRVQHWLLRPWKQNSCGLCSDNATVQEVVVAVNQACQNSRLPVRCLHCALVAYCLLRKVGAQPQFVIGVKVQPFASHAWVAIEGEPVTDGAEEDQRQLFDAVILSYPLVQ